MRSTSAPAPDSTGKTRWQSAPQVARTVKQREQRYRFVLDGIDEPVTADEKLPNARIIQLWNDASSLGERL